MRSLITLGVVSLVGVAGMIACGDDDSGDGPSNTAGTGGTSSGGGTGGTAGNSVGGGGTGGTGGNAVGGGGAGGAAPAPPEALATCTGCVELISPLVGPGDGYAGTNLADQVSYQFTFATPVDFSDGVVTWTIAAVEPNATQFINLYAQNGAALGYAGAYQGASLDPVAFPANQFRDVVVDLAAVAAAPGDAGAPDAGEPPVVVEVPDAGDAGDAAAAPVGPTIVGTFDKSQIVQLGITIGVSAQAPAGNSVIRVAVDEVAIAGVPGQADRTFTAGTEQLTQNQDANQSPPGARAPVHHP